MPNGTLERRVLTEDPLLELLELRARVEAELGSQLVPNPPVRRQGVRLAPGSVQRRDQQLPEALLIGIGRDCCFQLADHVAGVAEGQSRREVDLDEFRPSLIEPGFGAG